jgi:hypothetical protein
MNVTEIPEAIYTETMDLLLLRAGMLKRAGIEIISKYLAGRLHEKDLELFIKFLDDNPEQKKEIEEHAKFFKFYKTHNAEAKKARDETEQEVKKLRAEGFKNATKNLIVYLLIAPKDSKNAIIFRKTLKTDKELQKRTAEVKIELKEQGLL